ncbi:MAG: molybdopterin adenylyltransferase [Dehalococcoidales bacterium]|jgi:molybdenum cofactor synthesis domain-containing protein
MLRIGILTISDKGARGEREDLSGQAIKDILVQIGSVVQYEIIPDEKHIISQKLAEWADSAAMDIILTTGGTGLAERDVTPEATTAILEKEVPGIAEAMRNGTLHHTPMAMLSRAVAGIRAKCLIINLPGSPRAVRECLEVIKPALYHAVETITGQVTEHAPTANDKG